MRVSAYIILSALVVCPSFALAEPPPGGYEPAPAPPPQNPPPASPQSSVPVVEESSQPQVQNAQQGRGIEYGGHIVVPIWLNNSDIKPGLGIQGRIGWEFGRGFTTELIIGFMANGIGGSFLDNSLNDFWIGGGVRYAILNRSAFVPFIGAGAQINVFWLECPDDGTVCSVSNSKTTFGLQALAGLAYEVSPYAAIELGTQFNLAFKGKVFTKTQYYLSPFAGATFYF